MLSKVSIKNYKSLRDVQIDLERFTVFVGPNASGKSSILQGLDLLCSAFNPPYVNVEPALAAAASRGSVDQVEVTAEAGGRQYRYLTRLSDASPDQSDEVKSKWAGGGRGVLVAAIGAEWDVWKIKKNGPASLPRSVLLRLEASKLVQPNPAQPDLTVMAPDGSGLHSALANIALSDPETWQTLQDHLRQIVPTVRRLRHTMKGPNNSPALLFDMHEADSLSADQVSEGTLLVLGLLTALHAPTRPNLVLLDDIDRGLHPKAQRELIGLLRGVLESNPDLQIVATTHSPYLLGSMEPNEVRMTHLNDAGATACDSLTHHPKFPKWKDEMSAGEMWSLFGEKWVVGQEVPA